ncbi:hypothetical protein BJ508DRAFT_25973 [Ascobolus immersus RN42]|uniref:Uncharacterized protein n=1 Tax=Ascobolus immersus RN42 TaxID=1160509 RepID=A0A3N4IKJ8_ASCIM|nr:hypothetical protein BJ508DRAFT_25973 [Ascobolus immersus RN42]
MSQSINTTKSKPSAFHYNSPNTASDSSSSSSTSVSSAPSRTKTPSKSNAKARHYHSRSRSSSSLSLMSAEYNFDTEHQSSSTDYSTMDEDTGYSSSPYYNTKNPMYTQPQNFRTALPRLVRSLQYHREVYHDSKRNSRILSGSSSEEDALLGIKPVLRQDTKPPYVARGSYRIEIKKLTEMLSRLRKSATGYTTKHHLILCSLILLRSNISYFATKHPARRILRDISDFMLYVCGWHGIYSTLYAVFTLLVWHAERVTIKETQNLDDHDLNENNSHDFKRFPFGMVEWFLKKNFY